MIFNPHSVSLAGLESSAYVRFSVLALSSIFFLVLGNSDRVAPAMGETGVRILVRIMGLLLVASAVQYFVNGMADLGLIARP